jgi:RHS repeat-associated protein
MIRLSSSIQCDMLLLMADDNVFFTNKEIDYKLDLHTFGARYYTAVFPRFISPDPVSGRLMTPLTWNRYLYCRNDPINYIEPHTSAHRTMEMVVVFF